MILYGNFAINLKESRVRPPLLKTVLLRNLAKPDEGGLFMWDNEGFPVLPIKYYKKILFLSIMTLILFALVITWKFRASSKLKLGMFAPLVPNFI
ncbi:unnamed protein product [Caretta caretta]